MGGLSRRATIIDSVPEPKLIIEAANWGWKSKKISESQLEQQRAKAKLQLSALTLKKVDVMAIGSGDLALGLDWLTEQSAPFVLSNLHCEESGAWSPYREFSKAGFSIGVVAVISSKGPSLNGCTIQAPEESIKEQVRQHTVDLWIVASELSEEENRALSVLLPRSVFIDAKTRRMLETPNYLTSNAVLLSAGSRGKHVGMATIQLSKEAKTVHIVGKAEAVLKERKRYQDRIDQAKAELEKQTEGRAAERLQKQVDFYTKKIEALQEPVSEVADDWRIQNKLYSLDRSLQDEKETEELVQEYKTKAEKKGKSKDSLYSGPFVGTQACVGCHPSQYAHWQTTAHAKAWDTLVQEKRSQDLACFSCHVTGAHVDLGPQSPSEAKGLENVGCESCHGAGKEHVESFGQVDMIREPTLNNCTQCHDGVKDEGRFEAAVYYPKIRHPSLQSGGEQ